MVLYYKTRIGVSQADDCTSGFMSLDRMDAVLGNYGRVVYSPSDRQAIFPGVNFTCSGSIQSWIFGAFWNGNTASFTELQIWRSSGDGSYTKVRSTTVNVTERNATRLYYYPLSSPLPFQAGDILGYYLPRFWSSQLVLHSEWYGQGQLQYYYTRSSAASQLVVSESTNSDSRYQVLINMITGEPIHVSMDNVFRY